jgi:hypothetical protein
MLAQNHHFKSPFVGQFIRILAMGCKHSKVDQESAPVYENHDFLGQTPISSSKMLFKIYILS